MQQGETFQFLVQWHIVERLWLERTLRITKPWDCGMAGLEGTLKIVEPWNRWVGLSRVGLEGTLRITEPWNHSMVGLEGTSRSPIPPHTMGWLPPTHDALGPTHGCGHLQGWSTTTSLYQSLTTS